MTKKFTDIKNKLKPNSTKNFVWNPKAKKQFNLFIVSIVGLFICLNLVIFANQLKGFIATLLDTSMQSFESLSSAKNSVSYANFEDSLDSFKQAEQNFNTLANDTWFLRGSVAFTNKLTSSGSLLAESGTLLSQIALKLENSPAKFISANQSKSESNPNLTFDLAKEIPNLLKVEQNLTQVVKNLESLNQTILPPSLKKKLNLGLDDLKKATIEYSKLIDIAYIGLDLLGHQVPHSYLILIQNNYEIRATGGFFGSFIKAEVNKGVLTRFELEDVYKYDGVLFDPSFVIPPEFEGFTDKIFIRDANYTPDFAISAARIETMVQRAGGQSFDTVISIDQELIKDILKIVGPIKINGLNASVNAENYDTVLTYFIEAEKDINAEDKKVLKSFMSGFEQKIFQSIDFKNLVQILLDNLNKEHLQIYSKKSDIQQLFQSLNFTGSIPKELAKNQDYLHVNNTSVGGNKTDKFIKQRFIQETQINKSGKVNHKLTIRRHHSFSDRVEFQWQNYLAPFGVTEMVDFTRYILGRGDNKVVIKVYVPKGSKLVSNNKNIKTYSDKQLNKTYFLFEMLLKPQETKEVTFEYESNIDLDFDPVANYELLIQNQPGVVNTIFEKKYSYANSNAPRIYAHIPNLAKFDPETGEPSLDFDLVQDAKITAVFAK